MADITQDITEKKPWYQRRTTWIAIVTAILGCIQPVSAALGSPHQVPLYIYEILAAMGLYTLRESVENSK